MVVFTCGYCGESVQKPKVEKHYMVRCRNLSPNLSCMDCFKDFLGNDYEAHIKCITEQERYSVKGFTPKENKGEKKQNAWVEMLQSVLDEQQNGSKNVLRIIETISKYNNTPRKKPKFINFVKNVCGHKTSPKDIDQAWDLISVKLGALANLKSQNKNEPKKKDEDDETPKTNGHSKEKNLNGDAEVSCDVKQNGVSENGTSKKEKTEVGDDEDGSADKENEVTVDKKLSKKQRKEEKKRLKYEAELQSAVLPPEAEEEKIQTNKKGKKGKNKTDATNGDDSNATVESKNKIKKRKRQDTVGAASDTNENGTDNVVIQSVKKEKEIKKKLKIDGEVEGEAEDSICLHDQNVAKGEEEVTAAPGKFNWHAVIMSVLEKKGNEVPFKRLQKKVLGEYSEATGCEVDDRIADKFIKKLKSAPNVRVDKNRVWLVTDD